MWPFKKKEPEKNHTSEAIAKLQEFKKVGETFNYLGRTCIVTGHYEYWPHFGVVPLLHFDYADNTGKIHHCTARVAELPALINQQSPNRKINQRCARRTKNGVENMDNPEEEIQRVGAPSGLNVGLGWVDASTKPADHKPVAVIVDGERYKYWARAMWVPKFTLEDTSDDLDFGEYNEADDTKYWPEGWYEWNHTDEVHWRINEPVLLWAEVVMCRTTQVNGSKQRSC